MDGNIYNNGNVNFWRYGQNHDFVSPNTYRRAFLNHSLHVTSYGAPSNSACEQTDGFVSSYCVGTICTSLESLALQE